MFTKAHRPLRASRARETYVVRAGKAPRLVRPEAKIAMLTRHNDIALYNHARRSRLNGFILKQDSMEELNYAIKTMLRGGFYTPPSFSSAILDPSMEPDPIAQLTEREKSAFTLYAQGYGTREISHTLHISVKTAETHLHNIRLKMGISGCQDRLFGWQLLWVHTHFSRRPA